MMPQNPAYGGKYTVSIYNATASSRERSPPVLRKISFLTIQLGDVIGHMQGL